MLGKGIASFKNLAKKVMSTNTTTTQNDTLLMNKADEAAATGTFVVYVGGERVRQVVPTSYLNHPLFRILLEKSRVEFLSVEQKVGLVVPCSFSVFQDVVNAVESSKGSFDFGPFVEEFL